MMAKSKKKTAFEKQEELEYSVVKNFDGSKLSYKSMSFKNDVAMFLIKNSHTLYDCLSESLFGLELLKESLPIFSKVHLVGLKVQIESEEFLSKEQLQRLENNGFEIIFEQICADKKLTNVMYFDPERYDDTFIEFLKTYPDFLKKKYEKIKNS